MSQLILPILNGVFGFLLIHFLISLLFKPVVPKKVFGLKIQGIIPASMPSAAKQVGDFAKEKIDFSIVTSRLTDPKAVSEIAGYLDEKADHFLRKTLTEKMPVFSMFISDKLIDQMKSVLVTELQNMIPGMIEKFAGDLGNKIQLDKMVEEMLLKIDLQKMNLYISKKYGSQFLNLKLIAMLAGIVLGIIEIICIHYL